MVFTLHTLVDRVEFSKTSLEGQKPFVTKKIFHSRFELESKVYREGKNFMRINVVENDVSRTPFSYPEEHEKLDYFKEESLVSNSIEEERTIYVGNSTKLLSKETVTVLLN